MRNSYLNVFFGGLLIGFIIYFLIWGFGFIGDGNKTIFVLSSLFGIFMAFNIGGNDVANAFGTSVGSGTLTLTQALCIAAIFEVGGAVLAGSNVTNTIKTGLVKLDDMGLDPHDFIFIMMSALIAAALWLLIATFKGWPVSTTHAIVGAIVGSSLTFGFIIEDPNIHILSLVKWGNLSKIVISWFLSPLLGGVVSYLVYKAIKYYILDYNVIAQAKIDNLKRKRRQLKKEHKEYFDSLSDREKVIVAEAMNRDALAMKSPFFEPSDLDSTYYKKMYAIDSKKENLKSHKALEIGVPIVAALGTFVIGSMVIFKGFKNLDLGLSLLQNFLILIMISSAVWMSMFILAKTLRKSNLSKSTFLIFSWLQVFTASGFAFSHGSNDIANAVGPFAAIFDTLRNGEIALTSNTQPIVLLTFGVALVVGLWFIGKEVIATVGTHLTKIHPASGLSAELSAAGVVMGASVLGLPVSSTHILIGAIIGIGLVNREANWRLMKKIGLAWVVTLPAAALLSSVGFILIRSLF
ncbi:inorganic phosphate transporter [uncultured Campylobacter sp.]|uniref:inorganic phosphate transporter n=1 Tax=uncultured Campylobacter sp. TaxID=218934 RepID=UPI0026189489|nr:inorganic phosphate transporter [uncultured Campylobacter sp.]